MLRSLLSRAVRAVRAAPTAALALALALALGLSLLLSCAAPTLPLPGGLAPPSFFSLGPAAAQAATSAGLSAMFTPDRLGERATLDFAFSFSAPAGQVPPPLTQVELRYPSNLGIALSGLGLATCAVATLESVQGAGACPPDSVMGRGEAFTGIVLGGTPITETAPIVVLRAPDNEGRIALLFYAEGTAPVNTRIVFPGLLLPASSPFGGLVSIGVPLVPTLPGAPYISVLNLRATLGPIGVTYYERVGGVTLAYTPRGILLPNACPRGGFPFAAQFGFQDGSRASASTTVPCPKGQGVERSAGKLGKGKRKRRG